MLRQTTKDSRKEQSGSYFIASPQEPKRQLLVGGSMSSTHVVGWLVEDLVLGVVGYVGYEVKRQTGGR
jgi:hypothetical protein